MPPLADLSAAWGISMMKSDKIEERLDVNELDRPKPCSDVYVGNSVLVMQYTDETIHPAVRRSPDPDYHMRRGL